MNPCLHFASLEQYNTILSLNSIPPFLLTTLPPSQIAAPLRSYLCSCGSSLLSHLSQLSRLSHLFHLTPLIHLSHLPSSLLSYYSELTSLPTANRHLQNTNFLSLGRQDKHVWPIVRQPLMKAVWWDASPVLRGLAEVINMLVSFFLSDRFFVKGEIPECSPNTTLKWRHFSR